jgi:hypothetical protein
LPAVITPVPPLPVMAMETEAEVWRRSAVLVIGSSIADPTIDAPSPQRFDLNQIGRRRTSPWFIGT